MKKTVLFLSAALGNSSRKLLCGFTTFAKDRDWNVQRVLSPAKPPRNYLKRLIEFWEPIGIVIDCGSLPNFSRMENDLAVPIVLIDSTQAQGTFGGAKREWMRHSPYGYVDVDSRSLARQASELLMAPGFRAYAYVSSLCKSHWSDLRQKAFRDSIEQNGKPFFHFNGCGLSSDNNAAINRLGKWLDTLPKPCGLLAANDRTAAMVLSSAALRGISVPDNINVIGIDNDEIICETALPPLTSIEVDFLHGGYKAAETLEELLQGRKTVRALYGCGRIVHRLSTRNLHRSSPLIRMVLEHIRRHASEGISAADVLPLLGGSRRTAEKRFRDATGKSILEEILDVRFEKLLSLMSNGIRMPDALVDLSGFSSINHLRRQFKSRFNMNITTYCRKHGCRGLKEESTDKNKELAAKRRASMKRSSKLSGKSLLQSKSPSQTSITNRPL